MGLFDLLKSFISTEKEEPKIRWQISPFDESLEIIFPEQAVKNPENFAKSSPLFALQYGYLKSLQDSYPLQRMANGFAIPTVVVPDLGDDFMVLFDMPPRFKGEFQAEIKGNTSQPHFSVRLKLAMLDGSVVNHYQCQGAFVALTSTERYSLTPAEFQALKALERHQELPENARSEYENNWLIFQLQTAAKAGMKIDLVHFNQGNLNLVKPENIGVAVNQLSNGDIELIPAIQGINAMEIRERLGQLDGQNKRLLKVKNQFVLFDEHTQAAIDELFPIDETSGNRHIRRIDKTQVANFLKNPTAYLNGAVVDLDTGFSLRVVGVEKFIHKYFGGEQESGIDWIGNATTFVNSPVALEELIHSESELEEVETLIRNAQQVGASMITIEEELIDISDAEIVEETLSKIRHRIQQAYQDDEADGDYVENQHKMEKAVVGIEDNDEENRFQRFISVLNRQEIKPLDTHNLKRLPFPHQLEGINWILAHLKTIEKENTESGALLADDMGLGKTYMTLVSVSEYYEQQKELSKTQKPTLVVAPLSLLENWQAEIDETFKQSPFNDVVVLQGNGLKKFRLGGSEVKQYLHNDVASAEEIRYSLKVGKEYKQDRLDMPARLVLTTYQTLRDYQFSLCRIDWGIVIFDEAQNLKNPNTLATRAAKGLKSEFKLLATGTPVENSLKDFWCLMDTATPGLLGAWQEFRQQYINPISDAPPEEADDVKYEIGRLLREKVDQFMLRRTKEEKLQGLPEKVIYSGFKADRNYLPLLEAQMQGVQLQRYNEVISRIRNLNSGEKQGAMLAALRELKMISIHPNILEQQKSSSYKELLAEASLSSKILSLLTILKTVHQQQEKVLIFAESKLVQSYLVALVMMHYGIQVEVINGETAAVATTKNNRSRKTIIDEFQAQEGFGVLIMSPIAAGVGLTVTGANNVIHLERHWNPAKEAQATDRVYRIGQKKQVNVYLPMAVHPEIHSFDLQLHRLLNNKIDLSEAVVSNPDIEPEMLISIFE